MRGIEDLGREDLSEFAVKEAGNSDIAWDSDFGIEVSISETTSESL